MEMHAVDFEDLSVDGRTMRKLVLRKQNEEEWSGFFWDRTRRRGTL
jgi:hypothetical protein